VQILRVKLLGAISVLLQRLHLFFELLYLLLGGNTHLLFHPHISFRRILFWNHRSSGRIWDILLLSNWLRSFRFFNLVTLNLTINWFRRRIHSNRRCSICQSHLSTANVTLAFSVTQTIKKFLHIALGKELFDHWVIGPSTLSSKTQSCLLIFRLVKIFLQLSYLKFISLQLSLKLFVQLLNPVNVRVLPRDLPCQLLMTLLQLGNLSKSLSL